MRGYCVALVTEIRGLEVPPNKHVTQRPLLPIAAPCLKSGFPISGKWLAGPLASYGVDSKHMSKVIACWEDSSK